MIIAISLLYTFKQMKCIQYWPNEGSLTFGDIVVSLTKSEPFSDFIIRTFSISKVWLLKYTSIIFP